MTDQQTIPPPAPPSSPERRVRLVRVVRGVGWSLIGSGALILLYLAYLLLFTNLQTSAAQQQLLEQWELEFGAVDESLPGEEDVETGPADPVDPGDAYAAIWFERDGKRIVHDDTLFVVEGVSVADLRRGPGHYPDTQAPGAAGNFAISGHRTTYGAPFYDLDQLRDGDEVHVVDRGGRQWVYRVVESRIVEPTDVWVIGEDPLDRGGAWMTLTTCHPRFSAAQRLIVFAALVDDGPAEDAGRGSDDVAAADPGPTAPADSSQVPADVPTNGQPEPDAGEPGVAGDAPEVTTGDVPAPPVWVWAVFVLVGLGVVASLHLARRRRGLAGWRASVAVGAGVTVLLVVLFTTVFPFIERNLSNPTLGS